MELASHNSWSYLKPKKWWMKLIRFTAQCQDVDIKTQYEKYGVRCFDLRLRLNESGELNIVHGIVEYDYTYDNLKQDLEYLNNCKDCYIRMVHDVRTKKEYTILALAWFKCYCAKFKNTFPNITFWCGENLYTHTKDYHFGPDLACEEKYASVRKPKLIDDWYPKLYAIFNNKKNIKKGTDKQFLMIDFINYV